MKQQKLLARGFMLIEAVVGIALFMMLMVGVLQGVGFVAQRMAVGAQRHKALCEITVRMHENGEEIKDALPYTHHSISWHRVTVHVGNETVSVCGARRNGHT